MIQYNDTHIAAIGGKITDFDYSDKIDTYNFITEEFTEDVATLEFNRTQHLCALIPEGENGNPTIVICKYISSLSLHFTGAWLERVSQVPRACRILSFYV